MDRKKSKRSRGFPYACSFFNSKAQSFSPRGLFLQMISDNVQPSVAMPTQRHKSSAYVGDYLRAQIVTDRIAAIFAALHDRYGPYCSYFCCTTQSLRTVLQLFLLHYTIVTDRIAAILALWSFWREFRTVWLLFP
ncbi:MULTISPECIES: hypothetical protein [Paenibacillus]|uniref:hypothetical protein n=1 Tax=Paenibacillus TaxID=44249 RepID=UPI00117F81B2|nr:hypothetical protein [Paenibacillus odorifer]